MKCTSKRKYNCFYLTKYNINDFVKWLKEINFFRGNDISVKKIKNTNYEEDEFNYSDVLLLEEYVADIEYTEEYHFIFNKWYVYEHGGLYDYHNNQFKEKYDLVIEND